MKKCALVTLFSLLIESSFSYVSAQAEEPKDLPLQRGHTNAILEVKWSPNDKLLLTYSAADGYLHVWKMPERRLISSIEDTTVRIKGSDKRALRAFAWSDDSRLIATGNENGSAQVWEAETGTLLWSTRISDEYVTGVGFSRDAKYLAAIASPEDEKHKVVLLDATNGQIVKVLGTSERRFLTAYHDAKLVFSDDNSQLIAGDIGGIVTRWDLTAGSMLSTTRVSLCTAERRMPNSFVYSNDMALLVARCGLKTEVIDTNSGSVSQQFESSYDFSSSAVISRDNHLIAFADSKIRFFDLNKGGEVSLDGRFPITCGCDLNKDNSLIAIQDYFESDTVKLIDLSTKQTVGRLEAHPGKINALTFSPDGKVLASASDDRIVRLWDAKTGSLLRALAGHTDSVKVVAFAPDGNVLVTSSDDQTMKVWNVAKGELVQSIPVATQGIYGLSSVAFSPDGKLMVSTLGARVGLWDVRTWTLIREFTTNESHTSGEMTSCCGSTAVAARFDAVGRSIISAHEDGTIKIWNPNPKHPVVPGDELIRIVRTNKKNEAFALSPDEKVMAIGGYDTPPKLWNWTTRKPLRSLGEDASYVHAIVFNNNSQLLATSDIGGDILLWNVANGRLLREFDGGYSSDDALAFSPDGTRLASGGKNQNIIMWDVKSGARLWHVLPVNEIVRPTATELAEDVRANADKTRKERLAARETNLLRRKVLVSFSHFGVTSDPAETRLAESGRANFSLIQRDEDNATGIWLRLHNNSRLPLNLFTESVYMTSEKCGYQTTAGKFFNGLCQGSEIGIRFSVIDQKGTPVRYGFDFGGLSMLPPNTSVLFSVPRDLLKEGRSIVIRYTFQNENAKGRLIDYGPERQLKLTEQNLKTLIQYAR